VTKFVNARQLAARSRAEAELARAAEAARRAVRQEAIRARAPGSLRPLHARMVELYRRTEQRHRASAQVHSLFAERSADRHDRPGASDATAFLAAVADLLGTTSALITLRSERAVVAVAASDALAREAHELEVVMGEGPAYDAAQLGLPVLVGGTALCDRWPRYGPVAADLGIRAAIAAPLGPPTARFGTICALGVEPAIRDTAALTLDGISGALTSMLLADSGGGVAGDGAILPHLRAIWQDVVNQAIGMISVQCECSIDDAADILTARAFADERPIADVASQIVAG
jgi:hypothetical protein